MIEFRTSDNKIYELRSLRCRGSSGARPRPQRSVDAANAGRLLVAAQRCGLGKLMTLNMRLLRSTRPHCAARHQLLVNPTLSEIIAPLSFADIVSARLTYGEIIANYAKLPIKGLYFRRCPIPVSAIAVSTGKKIAI